MIRVCVITAGVHDKAGGGTSGEGGRDGNCDGRDIFNSVGLCRAGRIKKGIRWVEVLPCILHALGFSSLRVGADPLNPSSLFEIGPHIPYSNFKYPLSGCAD